MTQAQAAKLLKSLKQAAADAHTQWSQYKGAWENHVLVRVKKDIKGKAGVYFRKGEYAIAEPATQMSMNPKTPDRVMRFVYSASVKMDTLIGEKDLELV